MQFADFIQLLVWFLIAGNALAVLVGLVMYLAPDKLPQITRLTDHWYSTRKYVRGAESMVETDQLSLRHPRIFGVVILLAAFGEATVRDVFDGRRAQAADAAPTEHPWERMHMTHYFAAGTEPSTAAADLYAALGLDLAVVYRDDEVAAAAMRFDPGIRYLTRLARGDAVPENGAPSLKPLQTALLDARGLGDLARVEKGGTTFWWDLWKWMTEGDGPLRDRVMAVERPGFLEPDAFRRVLASPSDFLWNLLVYDEWHRGLPGGSA